MDLTLRSGAPNDGQLIIQIAGTKFSKIENVMDHIEAAPEKDN